MASQVVFKEPASFESTTYSSILSGHISSHIGFSRNIADESPAIGFSIDAHISPSIGFACDAHISPTIGFACDAHISPTIGFASSRAHKKYFIVLINPLPIGFASGCKDIWWRLSCWGVLMSAFRWNSIAVWLAAEPSFQSSISDNLSMYLSLSILTVCNSCYLYLYR